MKKYFLVCVYAAICLMNNLIYASEDLNHKLLTLAIESNDSDLIEILMHYGGDPAYPALNQAMDNQDYEAVQLLIQYGVDINSRRNNYLICTYIGDTGHSIHEGFGMTILEKAIEYEDIELIKYFLKMNANPLSSRKETFTNIIKGVTSCFLMEKTALYNAIEVGNLDIVILFIQCGVDINTLCYREYFDNKEVMFTPIQAALRFKNKDIASYLINEGAKI